MQKEYILITGATGFIGSHVIHKLLSEKIYKIVAIVRDIDNYKNVKKLKQSGVILIKGDFYNKDVVEKIFSQFPVRHVIHIAALRGGGAGTSKDYLTVNVKGTEVLLKESYDYKINKFIFCSSVGVFGTIPTDLPANINTKLVGDNNYHNSKILAEQKVKQYINKGLNAYIVRPTITYGPGDDGFPITLVKLVKRRIFLLPFKDIKIHLLNVASLAEQFCRMIKTDNIKHKVFIAADNAPISLKELVNLIHNYFYQRNYPFFLKLPNFLFKFLSIVFMLIRNEKWLTRVLLISQSWHYDIKETLNSFEDTSTSTEDSFIKNIHS